MSQNNFTLIQVHTALEDEQIKPYHEILSRALVADIIRETLDEIRALIKENKDILIDKDYIIDRCVANIKFNAKKRSQVVINATGTLLHTNLGRSPLNEDIWDSVKDINIYSSNLEYDINKMKRGKRGSFLSILMSKITGFESSLVLNNNASAIFLILKALAENKEVIVARAEQVQVGGGFRIPDILKEAGCKLIEVGTTNITTIDDYLNAITDNTALVLKVHSSNFKIRGFCDFPSLETLRKKIPANIPIVFDEGAGILDESFCEEEHISKARKAGVDLICFSGDKILGSVQAGIISGRTDLVEKIQKHQLARAFRVGKTVLSILEEFAIRKLNNHDSALSYCERMLKLDKKKVHSKALRLSKGLKNYGVTIVPALIETGGGAMPDTYYDSFALEIKHDDIKKVFKQMQNASTAIVCKIKNDSILLYPITIDEKHMKYVKATLDNILMN